MKGQRVLGGKNTHRTGYTADLSQWVDTLWHWWVYTNFNMSFFNTVWSWFQREIQDPWYLTSKVLSQIQRLVVIYVFYDVQTPTLSVLASWEDSQNTVVHTVTSQQESFRFQSLVEFVCFHQVSWVSSRCPIFLWQFKGIEVRWKETLKLAHTDSHWITSDSLMYADIDQYDLVKYTM